MAGVLFINRNYLATIFLFVFLLGSVRPSLSAEFTVQSNFDVNDLGPGNGLCVSYLIIIPPFVIPFCTLRGAIEETNNLIGPDIIHIPAGIYLLERNGINEDNAATGDLDITDSLRIIGKGADQTFINGNGLDRVFDIIAPGQQVILENLTIQNGLLPTGLEDDHKSGGGIRNRGDLILRNVVIENNMVNGASIGDDGGGILNVGTCSVVNTTIRGNKSSGGGGVYNAADGNLKIKSSTIQDNESQFGGGITNDGSLFLMNSTLSGNLSTSSSGGGIYNTSAADILQSTLAYNSSPTRGGGVYNCGKLQITNTIISNNQSGNCLLTLPIISLGNNIDDGNTCILNSSTDQVQTNPRLTSLQNHGGPTRTHSLYIGSPAVDKGQDLSAKGVITDQRGITRPVGNAFDIGAFETKKRAVYPLIHPLLFNDR